MDNNSYYQTQLFESIELLPEEKDMYYNTTPADGLVYNHLQQTLQVQTDLKNQNRVQEFLNSAVTEDDSIIGFDELYSSVTSESDLTYLQLMQQANAPFYTPIEPLLDTSSLNNNNNTFNFSSLPSVAGLTTGSSSLSPNILCHPLSNYPDIDTNNNMACDYYLEDNDMLAGLKYSSFDTCNNYFNDLNSSSFIPPLPSYPSPSIHETAASLSAISSDHHMAYRSNSTPMLTASYSFSSFSSASSNEDDSAEEDNTAQKSGPKKSASISFLPEKRKKRVYATAASTRKNSITKPQRKFTPKSNSISSESLSYYLSKQHLSDTEEEFEEDGFNTNLLNTSASSGMICKKGRNVDKACNHCKRSHLRCDNVRPCRRCVATGKVGCQDVKHKPRGRPRLQKRL
ncbi:hypothetical protein HPULCUR_002938 [Helicostylum pulchrum]|uniref:Zn(2)-C6 fungal-type domain-containing protein n=1 Tax=Helicostylum pulchrum TaxID=562976 RepID=A0ABP9XRZ0_9FUNG